MSKEHAAKVMQEIFSKGTYEGDLLGIGSSRSNQKGGMMSDTPRTDALIYRKNTLERQRHELLDLALALERELADAVAKERERCAKVCDEISNNMYWLNDRKEIAEDCAAAIRKGK